MRPQLVAVLLLRVAGAADPWEASERGSLPASLPATSNQHTRVGVVAQGTSVDAQSTTYRLEVRMQHPGANETIYALAGDSEFGLILPPAFQALAPFGAEIGGVNPAFFDIKGAESAEFDSWLTVGITSGDTSHALGQIGLELERWNSTHGLNEDDGAVFWVDPLAGPIGPIVCVGQLTVLSSFTGQAAFLMQGHTDHLIAGEIQDLTLDLSHSDDLAARHTWDEYGIFEFRPQPGSGNAPAAQPAMEPAPDPDPFPGGDCNELDWPDVDDAAFSGICGECKVLVHFGEGDAVQHSGTCAEYCVHVGDAMNMSMYCVGAWEDFGGTDSCAVDHDEACDMPMRDADDHATSDGICECGLGGGGSGGGNGGGNGQGDDRSDNNGGGGVPALAAEPAAEPAADPNPFPGGNCNELDWPDVDDAAFSGICGECKVLVHFGEGDAVQHSGTCAEYCVHVGDAMNMSMYCVGAWEDFGGTDSCAVDHDEACDMPMRDADDHATSDGICECGLGGGGSGGGNGGGNSQGDDRSDNNGGGGVPALVAVPAGEYTIPTTT